MKQKVKKQKYQIKSLTVYLILRFLVIITMIREIFMKQWSNVFLCILTLVLFLIPIIVDKRLNISLPSVLEKIILLFIFSAEILGEIQNYYRIIPYWDTILHTINGFIMAAIGFALIDILNRNDRFHIEMSPLFVALVAFTFSMTIGVLWEFFEFGMDNLTKTDMQKDRIVQTVSSVELNEDKENKPVVIKDIEKTTIQGKVSGKTTEIVIQNGYLDIGIQDTMKDLIVNCIGAIVFSFFGWMYIKGRGKGNFIKQFIPIMKHKAKN